LSNHVAPYVEHKWYSLGVQLLDEKDLKVLSTIESDYRGDADACCTKMFERWLEIVPTASWDQLVKGLMAPNIKLNKLANELMKKRGNVCMYVRTYVYMYVCMYVHMHVCTHVRMCVHFLVGSMVSVLHSISSLNIQYKL